MKAILKWLVIVALLMIYLAAFLAVLHPRASKAYKAYFINRTSSDWNPPHYPGAPQEGMNFGQPGLPEWVDSTTGLSFRDSMGRWTDQGLAGTPGISFTQPFEGAICVEIKISASPALAGKSFAIRIGHQTQTLQFTQPGPAEFKVPFNPEPPADKLEFLLPANLPRESEVDRTSGDTRRLGLALSSLRVTSGSCKSTVANSE